MPEIEIRPAAIGDLSAMVSLEHSYQTAYVWQMDRSIDKSQIAISFREIRLPRPVRVEYAVSPEVYAPENSANNGVLAAVMGGTMVGYISLKELTLPGTAWVLDLVVRDAARRRGIASALIMAAQDWAMKRNLKRMLLEMQSKNIPAIQLALKMGYEFCGYNDQYYGNRDLALFFAKFLR